MIKWVSLCSCYRANQSPRVYEKGAVDEEDQELRDFEADETQDSGKEQEYDQNEVGLPTAHYIVVTMVVNKLLSL